jgi:hypothetical protein
VKALVLMSAFVLCLERLDYHVDQAGRTILRESTGSLRRAIRQVERLLRRI